MIAIPAVDLREGACVQLVGGSFENERIRISDPVQVAANWAQLGFERLHLIDLDAATGRGSNRKVVNRILGEFPGSVQVGGGVRTGEDVKRLLDEGAQFVIVGTRAIQDPAWLAECASRHRGKLIVAADVRDRRVVTHGWQQAVDDDLQQVVRRLNPLPLAGILVTAVHREGRLRGTDLPLFEEVAGASHVPIFASGGISSLEDLRRLGEHKVFGAVLGMAIYTNAIDVRALAAEFGAGQQSA
jgi:phosphoribosylformimino-5-aminoimidazole carboxamide ribotide isomerase